MTHPERPIRSDLLRATPTCASERPTCLKERAHLLNKRERPTQSDSPRVTYPERHPPVQKRASERATYLFEKKRLICSIKKERATHPERPTQTCSKKSERLTYLISDPRIPRPSVSCTPPPSTFRVVSATSTFRVVPSTGPCQGAWSAVGGKQ